MNQIPLSSRIQNPELVEFFSKRKKGEQVTGAKYYKRVEIGKGKYRYYYTKEDYDKAVQEEKAKKDSASEKSFLSAFKSFFGLKDDKAVKAKVKADHSEFLQENQSSGITEDKFSKFSLEYFTNKLKIDSFFQGKQQEKPASVQTAPSGAEKVKVPKSGTVGQKPTAAVDPEKKEKFSVFKFLNKKYGQQGSAESTQPVSVPNVMPAVGQESVLNELPGIPAEPTVSVSDTVQKIEQATAASEENRVKIKAAGKIEKVSIRNQHQINQAVRDLLASKADEEMTDEDKELLSKYEGDGGQTTNNSQDKIGKGLLYEFYTPQPLIDKTWDIIKGYFKHGDSILEPSAGIGKWAKNVEGLKFDMLEIDSTSSRIAKILHPDHEIKNMPFEKMFLDKMNRSVKEYTGKKYSGVVGNPPYGAMTGTFKASEGKGWKRYENYFLKRSLDTVEEGGIVAMVVPSSFLQKDANDPEKKRVMEGCELIDAYRFPEGAFSNTKIGTDLVILRKNTTGTQNNTAAFGGRFFQNNPEKVLGEQKTRKNRFGKEETYIEGDASKYLDVTPGMPVEMSQAHKDAIAAGLIGNDNAAKGTSGVTKKERKNRESAKTASEQHKIKDPVAAAKAEPREVFDQAEFNEEYQKGVDEIDYRLVSQTNTLGYITDFSGIPTDPKKICYIDGQYMPHYLYTTGNIKEKLSRLEADKDAIVEKHGEEFYRIQQGLLEKAMPEKIKLENITLSPIDSFSRSFAFSNFESAENYVDSVLGRPGSVATEISVSQNYGRSKTLKVKIKSYGSVGYAVTEDGVKLVRMLPDGKWAVIASAKDILQAKKTLALISKEDWNFKNWDSVPELKERFINAHNAVKGNDYSSLDITEEQKNRLTLSADEAVMSAEIGSGETLQEKFFKYIKDIDGDNFSGYSISRYDIIDYCNGAAVTGKDADANQRRRKERAKLGERLYKQFIQEELTDSEREQLETEWNDSFNSTVEVDPKTIPVKIEGLSKTFKGKEYKIRDVQTQFVSKFIQKGVGCAAHQVGVGKTMSGIIATVSNMQMGRSKKPVIVVPSSVLQKWEYEFKELYPGVPLNTLGTKQLNDMLAKKGKVEIEEGSVTVMSYDAFERFSFSEERFGELTKDLQDQIENPDAEKKPGKRDKAKEGEKAAAVAGKAKIDTDSRLLFDEAGFDHITVDEAHNFNNIFTDTKTANTGTREANEFDGITGGRASTRGMKLWLASRHVLEKNNNRNILLLTATPFTNNPLQVYSLISLMAKERLQDMGINNIREFIAAFVETGTEYALEANGQVKEKKTVRSFKNAKAFRKLINEFFDYKTGEDAGVNRPDLNRKSVLLPATEEMKEMRGELEKLFDLKENGKPVPGAALSSIGNQQLMNISPALVRSTTMGGKEPESIDVTKSILETINRADSEEDFITKINEAYKKIAYDVEAREEFVRQLGGGENGVSREGIMKFFTEQKAGVKERMTEHKAKIEAEEANNAQSSRGQYGQDFVGRSPKIRFALDSIAKFYKDFQSQKPGVPVPGQLCFLPRGVEFTNEMKDYLIKTHGIPADAIGIMTPKEKTDKAKDKEKRENGISRFSEMTEDFNDENGKLKIIIGSDVIKEGVDLNGNTAVAYNLMTSWNPTDEQQKLGRAWRQGNKQKNVHFVDVQIEDSIDSKLYQKQAEKASRINDIFADSGGSAIDVADLNPDELKLDVITDPERKAKIAVQQESAKAALDRQEKQSKLLAMQSALEGYYMIRNDLESAEKDIEEAQKNIQMLMDKYPDSYAENWDYNYEKKSLDRSRKERQSAKNRLETADRKMELYRLDKNSKEKAQETLNKLQEDLDKAREIEQANSSEKEKLLFEKFKKEKEEMDKEKARRGRNSLDKIVEEHVKEILESVINFTKSLLFKNRIAERIDFLKSKIKIQRGNLKVADSAKQAIYDYIQKQADLKYLKRYEADQLFKMLSGVCKAEGEAATFENMLMYIGTMESDLHSMFAGSEGTPDDGLEYEY